MKIGTILYHLDKFKTVIEYALWGQETERKRKEYYSGK